MPYFLWTIKRDVVDHHSLSCDQMLNHYGKTASFTTKVSGGRGRRAGGQAGSTLPPETPAPLEPHNPMGRRSPQLSSQDWRLLAWPEAAWHQCPEMLGTAPRKPPQSLCAPHCVPGWAQGHRITVLWAAGQAPDRASDRSPHSLAWALGPGVALGRWGGGVGHPHLCCDFQLLGALLRHPLLTLTPFQPPATPGSHSPLTLKAEVGVGPAGTDRPAHAPR